MIKEAIEKIVTKQDLSFDEAYTTMKEIMAGETTAVQNAAFLAALSTKSTRAETIEEISGCATAMREAALAVPYTTEPLLEIVGTGGDGSHTFNISTTSALLCAAAGVKVSKHGNRAASSLCGTADCFEALGVNIRQNPEVACQLLDQVGIAFLFAQEYHSSMKYVAPIRRELGIRTVFNILGPLTNPARPAYYLLGVYDAYLVEPLAQVLLQLGVKRALVVHGCDRMDELSLSAPSCVCEVKEGSLHSYEITPEEVGLKRAQKEDLVGGDAAQNAQIVRDISAGSETGAKRDAALLNAGAALMVAGAAPDIASGVELARAQITSGAAQHTLEQFARLSYELAPKE